LFFATSIASACRVWLKTVNKDLGTKIRSTRDETNGDESRAPRQTGRSWDVVVGEEDEVNQRRSA
jgi:hypothetical protein